MSGTAEIAPPQIHNHRLIKRIGRGAFGEVWLAEETLSRIYRAVKIVPASEIKKQRVELEGIRRYQQRSRGHPNLVQVLTIGETADALYYVMEAADNALGSKLASPEDYEPCTLASVLAREHRLSIDTALEYTGAMLAGIEHLHRAGLAHRDLKPPNVLFVDGALKVADVGLASPDKASRVGTPGYRTPEGTADDLYAIGVMLYEMITGQPASRFPELPADLDQTHEARQLKHVLRLIDRACDPQPSHRFDSPTHFLSEVRRTGPKHPGRIRTRRWALAGVCAVALIAVASWTVRRQPTAVDWTDLQFVAELAPRQWTAFPARGHYRPSRLQLDPAHSDGPLGDATLKLTGVFDVGCAQPEALMSLMLAVDDRIVHVIYWDKPGPDGRQRRFTDLRFRLRNHVLDRAAEVERIPVYVVLAATADFFEFCDEYVNMPQAKRNQILIGHIEWRFPAKASGR